MTTGLLIDMDGVIDRGSQLIPGADRFINALKEEEIPFLFLTNNSQRTRRDVATKLQRLGMMVEQQHIFTCGKPSPVMMRVKSWGSLLRKR